MSGLAGCPACAAPDLEPVAAELAGPSVTSDSRPAAADVQNVLCPACGLVANAAGARGHTGEFYAGEYDLLAENTAAEFLAYQAGKTVGVNERRCDFLVQTLRLPARGRILEIGPGKGLFLRKFVSHFPGWEVRAVEPSRNAIRHFRGLIPEARVHEGPFETAPFRRETFDLLVALGVMEHLPDPRGFLQAARDCLAPGGSLYVEVPNFVNNPSDLVCYDHLNRFVPGTLANLLRLAGFAITALDAPSDQVPMRCLATPSATPAAADWDARRMRDVLDGHLRFVRETFASYRRCAEDARARGGRMALFGLGIIGLAGILRGHVAREELAAFVDDNHHFWGSRRLGVPVGGPALIAEGGITHLAFSVNPCYLARIAARLRPLPLRLFLPEAALGVRDGGT